MGYDFLNSFCFLRFKKGDMKEFDTKVNHSFIIESTRVFLLKGH